MPRHYKPKPGNKPYVKHNEADIKRAIQLVEDGMSYRKASEQCNIPKTVIFRHHKNPTVRPQGGQTILGDQIENHLVKRIKTCAEWGFPLDTLDLRYLVKSYLDKRGIDVAKFKENVPGPDWVESFLRRHKETVAQRMCQNIKRSRAAVSRTVVNEYFDNLGKTLEGVPASNILNYDETNLSDDPGRKKVLMKRGVKYPERIMNHSKSAVSLMFAGAADGTILAPYVVYKAINTYDTWTIGGPPNTRYNRSKSGWFDAVCFSDWFMTIALPYFNRLEGPKVLIGDNLSSHLTVDVIQECENNNISFVFFPANATHLCQPLDVCFFRPMKMAWRPILEKWKKRAGKRQSTVPKDVFPHLLKELMTSLETKERQNMISGFNKCGILPLNREKVLSRLPADPDPETENTDPSTAVETVDDCIINLLQEMRYSDEGAGKRKRKKKVSVEPGKSVTAADLADSEASAVATVEETSSGSESDTDTDSQSEIEDQKGQLRGILPIAPSDINVGTWVVVKFAVEGIRRRGNVRKLFLGRVEQIIKQDQEMEILFLRPSEKSTGSSFVFPEKEDRCLVSMSQVVGKTARPEEMRRGILKFDLQPNKDHCSIVISPLTSLIKEQVQTLQEHGISTYGIYEGADRKHLEDIKAGKARVLLASPESILSNHWKKVVEDQYASKVCAVVYDEAHCISEWGLEFREDYRKVGIIQSITDCPVLALTATCTQDILSDVSNILGLSDLKIISCLPERPNITLCFVKESQKHEEHLKWLITALKKHGRKMMKTIVYVNSVEMCELLYIWLHSSLKKQAYDGDTSVHTRLVEMFHANTDKVSKERILNSLKQTDGCVRVLLATVAVGMGIDLPDIGTVVVWGLPPSLLQLWQQIGRSGRGGQQSLAICYAYPRSIANPCNTCRSSGRRSCTCKHRMYLRKVVETDKVECQRRYCLKYFSLNEENDQELELMTPHTCDLNCTNTCICEMCNCCILCMTRCSCLLKSMSLKDKISFIYNI